MGEEGFFLKSFKKRFKNCFYMVYVVIILVIVEFIYCSNSFGGWGWGGS